MPGLNVYLSNHLETLAEKLARLLRTPLSSPLEGEIIVVQSKGMERWVIMELARCHGICANVHFPFPKAFVNQILNSAIPEFQPNPVFDPHVLTWEIMKLIPSCLDEPGFESIRYYLENDPDHVKRFQLSRQIAYLFDQYLIFRPEMIIAWEGGKTGQGDEWWQADLWRKLVGDAGNQHPAAFRESFFQRIRGNAPHILAGLPKRVSIFGISTLPRFYLEIIHELSRRIDVHLFLMGPSREFWGDIRSDREIHRELTRLEEKTGKDILSETLYLERGNSLLASMGTIGRDFFKFILDFQDQVQESFIEPLEKDILSMVASDIFHLRDRGQADMDKGIYFPEDESIEIHSCHSPMRELEVLHDNLLAMFDKNHDLLPKDILVMTPDMDTYAPFIQVVFDSTYGRIPFSIADRTIRKEGSVMDAFLEITGLFESRFGVSQVLSLLEIPAVRDRFDLSENDLARIRKWVSDTRIRWGIDDRYRRQQGLPATGENTWMAGLERLLLGYAMPGQGKHLFGGILPYDHIEGSETQMLGRFLTFTRHLFDDVTSFGQPRTISKWSRYLRELLERFFIKNEETEDELQVIWRILHQLNTIENQTRFGESVGVDVIRCYLERVFGQEGHAYGFMTGGVTFCAMLPMRSIPFKVICLIGMNNAAYPRQSEVLGFDLMTRNPKPADRSRRNDDRYLFLEAILSARDKLYISYVGRSMEDNAPIPPSALVSELLDYLEQGFKLPDGDSGCVSDHVVTVHHLQAFNPSYFAGGEKLFSYSDENCRAARRLIESSPPPAGLLTGRLPEPPEDWKTIELSDLIVFYRNPARFLLERRLGIGLGDASQLLEEDEPFDLGKLEKYVLEQTLIEEGLKAKNLETFYRVAKASGQLPHGQPGAYTYDHLAGSVQPFIDRLKSYLTGEKPEPLVFSLPVAGFHLKGTIASLYPKGLIRYRFTSLKGKDYLGLWMEHLVLNSIAGNAAKGSFLFGEKEAWQMTAVDEASKWLALLVEQYWKGLMAPLKFFPEAAWAYVKQVHGKGKSRQEGMRTAEKKWAGSDFSRGEGEDAYYQLCFGGGNPIDSEFQDLAEMIVSPLLQYQRKM
jgi:exodeoxyribonuclease V gamma subunit